MAPDDVERTPAPSRAPAAADEIERVCLSLEDVIRQAAPNGHPRPASAEAADLLKAAAENCPDGVIVTSPDARIVLVNGRLARMTGFSHRELQALTLWDLTHVTSQIDFDVLWREFLRAGRQLGTYTLRRKDGSPVSIVYCSQANVGPRLNVSVVSPLPPQS